jgi:single-strand DNA-binding protein
MASLNRVQLIGNCGRDPEIKSFNNGNRVANFSIACSESWTDKSTGEKKEKVEWINVAVFNDGLIGIVERYVKKGSKIFVEGKYQTRKYEKDGRDHYATEVVIQHFGGQIILLGDPKGDDGGSSNRTGSSGSYGSARSGDNRSAAPRSHDDGPDDPIPF